MSSWRIGAPKSSKTATVAEHIADASAVLALVQQEPGAERVRAVIRDCWMSTVNLAEVLTKLVQAGMPIAEAKATADELPIRVVPFSKALAETAAALRGATTRRGLSLGDRACLALAQERRLPALTADRSWRELGVGVEVVLIR
jgi:PIN domain nuclease of toxin-antitoxin system